jgi:hypothetical protein
LICIIYQLLKIRNVAIFYKNDTSTHVVLQIAKLTPMFRVPKCAYFKCGGDVLHINEYCKVHSESPYGKLKTLHKSEMQEILRQIASTHVIDPSLHVFTSMANEIVNEIPNVVDSTDHHLTLVCLKNSILHNEAMNAPEFTQFTETSEPSRGLTTETSEPSMGSTSESIRRTTYSTQSTSLFSKVESKRKSKHTSSRTRRFIFEKDGIKTTIEEKIKDARKFTEKIESLTVFTSEKEVDEFVEQTTHTYEIRLNEYAKNIEMIKTALGKWMCELHQMKQLANLNFETIRGLVENQNLELSQKFDAVYCRLIHVLLHQPQSHHILPVIQSIVKYTTQTFPDGNLKVFHCKFGDDHFSKHSIIVSIPEILLRALSPYRNTIHAFFVVKFIPFKSAFMKHRRQLELDVESTDETVRCNAIETLLIENDTSYQDARFPEIDPRTCMIKK